jgi:predicted permease
MIGDLTIPLSLLATGAQLGSLPSRGAASWRPLAGVMAGRLIVAPAVAMLFLKGASVVTGFSFTEAEFITAAIIVAMPVAISCMVFAERFEGDCELSANAIFVSTLISLATAPLMIVASRWLM